VVRDWNAGREGRIVDGHQNPPGDGHEEGLAAITESDRIPPNHRAGSPPQNALYGHAMVTSLDALTRPGLLSIGWQFR